jgi:hypothetical protein
MRTTPLESAIEAAAAHCTKVSHQKYGRLWDAYERSCSVLSKLAEQGGRDTDGECQFGSERLSLTANMLQSCFIVENLIASGYYVASMAILRQHMETLARIIELRKGIKSPKIPNVKNLPFKLSSNYGALTKIFHTLGGEYLAGFAEVTDSKEIASYLPEFKEDWAYVLLAVHIGHLVTLASEIHILQVDLYRSEPVPGVTEKLWEIATIMVEAGFWERFEPEKI